MHPTKYRFMASLPPSLLAIFPFSPNMHTPLLCPIQPHLLFSLYTSSHGLILSPHLDLHQHSGTNHFGEAELAGTCCLWGGGGGGIPVPLPLPLLPPTTLFANPAIPTLHAFSSSYTEVSHLVKTYCTTPPSVNTNYSPAFPATAASSYIHKLCIAFP